MTLTLSYETDLTRFRIAILQNFNRKIDISIKSVHDLYVQEHQWQRFSNNPHRYSLSLIRKHDLYEQICYDEKFKITKNDGFYYTFLILFPTI